MSGSDQELDDMDTGGIRDYSKRDKNPIQKLNTAAGKPHSRVWRWFKFITWSIAVAVFFVLIAGQLRVMSQHFDVAFRVFEERAPLGWLYRRESLTPAEYDMCAQLAPGFVTRVNRATVVKQQRRQERQETMTTTESVIIDGPPHTGAPPVLIKSARVWNGVEFVENSRLVVRDGVIEAVGTAEEVPTPDDDDLVIYDANGRCVTPGLVDLHSHSGVYSFPSTFGTSDGNEQTNPITPYVRAIDAFDPEDWALDLIRGGGVTTAQILPGSGNLMGGEGFHVKYRGNRTVEGLRITDTTPGRVLKWACGENPKRGYGSRKEMPASRMGNAWKMREALEQAQDLLHAQTDWCHAYMQKRLHADSRFPTSLEHLPLIDLLRGRANLNTHCYQVHDLEMIMRLSDEFNFRINAFHHGLECWKIPEPLRERNITVATFSDLWGYKMEAYDASVHGPRILEEAGVNVVLKTDHPVEFARFLMFSAAKSHHYGLSAAGAINSVTRNPANSMGLGHRIGRLDVGYDADFVVWDRNPLAIGARPVRVYVEGTLLFEDNLPLPSTDDVPNVGDIYRYPNRLENPCPTRHASLQPNAPPSEPQMTSVGTYAVTGAEIIADPSTMERLPVGTLIYVVDGVVECIGSDCTIPQSVRRFTFNQSGDSTAIITPGLIEAAGTGTYEVGSETTARDGTPSGSVDAKLIVEGVDGLEYDTRHMHAALAGGVTASLVTPSGGFGVGGFALTGAQDMSTTVVTRRSSVMYSLGHGYNADVGSLSAQWQQLRTKMRAAVAAVEDPSTTTDSDDSFSPLEAVVRGEITLILGVMSFDDIRRATEFQVEFNLPHIALYGAAEVAHCAPMLNEHTRMNGFALTVILPECAPDSWESKRCLVRGTPSHLAANAPNVNVVLATLDPDSVRNLRWRAGFEKVAGEWTFDEALQSVTTNLVDALGAQDTGLGRITVGKPANFVGWSGDPLKVHSNIELVAIGSNIECHPQQF